MKTFILFTCCLFITFNINAQCIVGDCQNGFGILKQEDGSYREGFFEGGSPEGMEKIFTSKYVLVNVYEDEPVPVRFGFFKKGSWTVLTNNSNHTGIEINVRARKFYKITLDNDNLKTLSRNPLANNNKSVGCTFGDCVNGYGVFIFKNGSYYIGAFENGKQNGVGKTYYKGTGSYFGEYVNGNRVGYGMFVWQKGNVETTYYGQFNGEFNGKGVYFNEKRQFRAGYYENGKIKKVITSTIDKR